jgi:uncharacterized protein YoxC
MEGQLVDALGNTNLMLGIMAAVSVLEALVLLGIAAGAFMAYRRVMTLINEIESRQIAPLRAQVDAILTDVKSVTARVSQQTERVDHAIAGTMERVDTTAEKVKSSVRDRVDQVAGVVRGVRGALAALLSSDSRPKPPATAAGRL